MSHYHLEIILPPVTDVMAAVETILKQFDENDGENGHSFWDWWVIGGRWAGNKAQAHMDKGALKAFDEWMTEEKIMVSAFQAGKQGLADADTVKKVDAKWREMFPDQGDHCTLFAHSNDQYGGDILPGDICKLEEMAQGVAASHIIIAGLSYSDDGALEACFMTQKSVWNGVSHIDSTWDGLVASAVKEYQSNFSDRCTAEHREKRYPKPDWLVVTVDYHS